MNGHLLMISGDRTLVQGKQGAFYNTLEELHKYWDRIDVICPHVSHQEVYQIFENVHLHSSPNSLIFQPWFIYRKGREIHQKNPVTIMTVHEYPPFYNGLGVCMLWLKTHVPYLLEIHHVVGYPKASNFKESIYKLWSWVYLNFDAIHARAVRVVNQHQVPKFLRGAGIRNSKIVYIPSIYIDQTIFKPNPEPKEFDIIFVGRLAENKGIKLFVDVAKKAGFKACIVGEGPLLEDVKKWTEGSNITLKGWVKDQAEIARLLNASKVFVLTSYNEGGPRVIAEAMACGVPVVATPVGIVPDLADICLIADWKTSDIVKKIKYLLENSEEYQTRSERGLRIIQNFQKSSAIKNYSDELKKLT